mmetsp:Transcript_12094/g.29535  ORF Transcript_12094/g.29535 Transcript_12094/m.29535 type:complete len:107 (+) Transcript_12094:342-662(+)
MISLIQWCMKVGLVHPSEALRLNTIETFQVGWIDNPGGGLWAISQDPTGKQGMAMLEKALLIPRVGVSGMTNHVEYSTKASATNNVNQIDWYRISIKNYEVFKGIF